MYRSFYNLKHQPFQISTDPKFLWLGEKHEEALATLRYGILGNKGFLLLTGDVGTGKTTLINALLKELDTNVLVATIRDPALDILDFYNYTAYVFGMKDTFASKGPFLIQFERFLLNAHATGKKVLLIIDEAQRINQGLLEEVRLLSNIEKEETKLLNIFFVGQNEFNDTLLRQENRAIRQRITVNYHILPLSEQETRRYIRHRLEVAGAEEEVLELESLHGNERSEYIKDTLKPPEDLNRIFSDEAVNEVYLFSKGYPRLINVICDRSLLTGFVEESRIITRKHVEECARELVIPQLAPVGESAQKTEEPWEEQRTVPAPSRDVPSGNNSNLPGTPPDDKPAGTIRAQNKKRLPYAALLLALCVGGVIVFVNGNHPVDPENEILKTMEAFPTSAGIPAGQKRGNDVVKNKVEPVDSRIGELPGKDKSIVPDKHEKPEGSAAIPGDTAYLEMDAKDKQPVPGKMTPPAGHGEITVNAASGEAAPGLMQKQTAMISIPEVVLQGKEPARAKEIEVNSLVTFEKLIIPFPSNSNFPPSNTIIKLDMLADTLSAQSSYKIIVVGHTDSMGNESFNEKLSEFRANAVKGYLLGKGLRESDIITKGLGSRSPVATNDTPEGRMANRRVEIEIVQ